MSLGSDSYRKLQEATGQAYDRKELQAEVAADQKPRAEVSAKGKL